MLWLNNEKNGMLKIKKFKKRKRNVSVQFDNIVLIYRVLNEPLKHPTGNLLMLCNILIAS